MTDLRAALWAEALKARRSRVPAFTALGFALVPFMGGLFMLLLEDPDHAQRLGFLAAKAEMFGYAVGWSSYLGLLAQATAVGGILLFAIVATWVFGREFADRTAATLLALPTSRWAIVAAKFAVVAAWSAGLVVLLYLLGLGVGAAIGLPGWSPRVALGGAVHLAATAALTLALVPPVAWVASAGRGYLPPMGFAILTLFLAQVLAATGWGGYCPWSVPALHSGMAGSQVETPGAVSHLLVLATGLAGTVGTFAWWRWADQAG